MSEPVKETSELPDEGASGGYGKDYLNYFGGDRWIHAWLAEKRTRLLAAVFPPLVRLGVVPDTISYVGIALLAGVVLYFVRSPVVAVCFLVGHIICDGMDGAYARHTGKASQSGAFTDLVCDQLGMLAVAMLAVFHNLVAPPLVGAVYISLYLVVVVFGVLINVMGLGVRITVTSKYFLYFFYAVWAFVGWNILTLVMSVFSVIMAVEVVIGYIRLKRGIRKKFDAPVRFTGADPYSGRINYALNVAVPFTVLLVILIGANWVQLRALLATPRIQVSWEEQVPAVQKTEEEEILGFGVRGDGLVLLVRDGTDWLRMRRYDASGAASEDVFDLPGYLNPSFCAMPVDGNILLVADRTTHLLMGFDLDASFVAKRAVITLTLPMDHLRVTAMAVGRHKEKKVWLVANYLYTRRTYVIDPERAVKRGSLLRGVVDSYVNGGFPAGMTFLDGRVIEFNQPPFSGLLYCASLERLVAGRNLLRAGKTSFAPPTPDAIGPAILGDNLVMLAPRGQLYRLPLKKVLPNS